MRTSFRLAPHTIEPVMVVELWRGSQMIGTLYPSSDGFRIISKHQIETAAAVETEGVIEVSIRR